MKTKSRWIHILPAMGLALTLCGCSRLLGGAAGGAVGTGAGYEYNARRQMNRIDEDLAQGRIDQNEYEIRKSQIERGSLVY